MTSDRTLAERVRAAGAQVRAVAGFRNLIERDPIDPTRLTSR